MKSSIFTFAMISCFLLSQALSLESRPTTLTTLTTTPSETSSAVPTQPQPVQVVHPFAKAGPSSTETTTTTTTTTKAPGQQCKEIGSACSISDECCSRRCIFYRGRCAY